MTLVRRTLIGFCIALATALGVAALVAIDTGSRPVAIERLHRN